MCELTTKRTRLVLSDCTVALAGHAIQLHSNYNRLDDIHCNVKGHHNSENSVMM